MRAGNSVPGPDELPELLRRDATRTPLHALLREHLETFLARFEDEHGGRRLPLYVERELRAFLACGDPARGFCRIRCPSCASNLLLPFSCKGRGFCPSCGGRRMAEVAAHLTDSVLPFVPVRQWVLSVPWSLRQRLASNPSLCRDVARAFLRAVFGSYRRRARAEGLLDPSDVGAVESLTHARPRAHPGAVNFVQRFGSWLALNVHLLTLVLDGVHITRSVGDRPQFHAAPSLTQDEVLPSSAVTDRA